MIASVLLIAVISTARINNMAVQELNNKAAEYMNKGELKNEKYIRFNWRNV